MHESRTLVAVINTLMLTAGSNPRRGAAVVMLRTPVLPDRLPLRVAVSPTRCSHGRTGVVDGDGVKDGVCKNNDGKADTIITIEYC